MICKICTKNRLMTNEVNNKCWAEHKSFLLDELLLDRIGDGKVDVKNLVDEHIDDFIFVSFEILLDFVDLLLSLSFECDFKLLILFLRTWLKITLSFILSNSASLFCLYLVTSKSAAYLASLSFRVLHY